MSEKPNVWVDIKPTLDLKIKALLQHRSQVGAAAQPERQAEFKKMITTAAGKTGKKRGLKRAEAFRRLRLKP